jgi:hypothetical protein
LTIGFNLGLWIYNEISAYFSFNFISIWAAGCVLRLSCIGWEAQIHFTSLFKTVPYFNRSISPRFTRAHQYPCCCDPLTLRSMETPRFVLLVAPAAETTSFRSDDCLSIVSSWGVVLRYPIKDLYGESCCPLVPCEKSWYHSVPNSNSLKFDAIDHYIWQLVT